MWFITLITLITLTFSQDQQCQWSGGPNNRYTFNLTSISRYRLEYVQDSDHRYYYTPCHNGEVCQQGTATFYGNAVQYMSGNQCRHYLSVDHHDAPTYFFGGASWAFQYNDGQVCDVTQQPRQTNIWYQCDEIMQTGAYMYDVDEPETCRYNMVVRSPLACVPENSHHANCQWKWTQGNQSYYLDLSSQNGTLIYDRETRNGYQHFYTPCQNGMHCYQQTGGQIKVMSLLENDVTHTCEHYLAIWQEGRVEPLLHLHEDQSQTHWSFHYWLNEKCSDGTQGEETIRWYCDPTVANSSLINATYDGGCRWEMNIKSSLACPSNEMYQSHNGFKLHKLKF
eukprot:22325_1